jgi:competence protein CoiA
MQYAIVNNEKVEAFSNGKGICPMCNAPTVAKCGPRNIHHWAHDKKKNCDSWWENETEWHRKWKNLFPEECREITHFAENGEMHRADIKTQTNIIIEIQHSAITDTERLSRELFYKNLVWVVDGRSFQKNFDIHHMLPNPKSEIASDLIWAKAQRHMLGTNNGIFYRLSEARIDYPDIKKHEIHFGMMHPFSRIQSEIEENYNGFHQYDWVRPRKTWLDATCLFTLISMMNIYTN